MQTAAHKKEDKSQTSANSTRKQQNTSEATAQLMDSRPEAAVQLEKQERANTSPRVAQLQSLQERADNSTQGKQVAQLQVTTDQLSSEVPVPQNQRSVEPTTQLKSATPINDDKGLEQEADVMGAKALQLGGQDGATLQAKGIEEPKNNSTAIVQRKITLAPLKGEVKGFGTMLKNAVSGGTIFTKLTKKVELFNAADDAGQAILGKEIVTLGEEWIAKHAASKTENDTNKFNDINTILNKLKTQTPLEKEETSSIAIGPDETLEQQVTAIEAIEPDKKYYLRFALELRKIVKRDIPEVEMRLIWIDFSTAMKKNQIRIPAWQKLQKDWGKTPDLAEKLDTTDIQLANLDAFRKDIQSLIKLVEGEQGEAVQAGSVTLWSDIANGRKAANNKELNNAFGVSAGGTPLNATSMGALLDLFAVGALEGETPDLENNNHDLLINNNNAYMEWGGKFNVWAAVSAEFASKASGDVHVYLPAGAATGSVFWTAELPELRKNPDVKSIFIHGLSKVGKAAMADKTAKKIDQEKLNEILNSPSAWTTSTVDDLIVKGEEQTYTPEEIAQDPTKKPGKGISGGYLKKVGVRLKAYKMKEEDKLLKQSIAASKNK